MANMIGTNYAQLFKSFGQVGKQRATTKNDSLGEAKTSAAYGGNFSVELSDGGLSALASQQNAVDDAGSKANEWFVTDDEKKLSSKAQNYLDKLREKYGDYDFIIANDMSDPQSLTAGSTKDYSVIFSTDELERMASDEKYAEKMLGKVKSAVDTTKWIEDNAQLGEGVQFSQIGVEFGDDGHTKLFAQLEKMSEEQRERLEAAKEKRAEEKKEADKKAEDEEEETFSVQLMNLEADSEEDLLSRIWEINWDNVPEDKYVI